MRYDATSIQAETPTYNDLVGNGIEALRNAEILSRTVIVETSVLRPYDAITEAMHQTALQQGRAGSRELNANASS